MKIIGLDIKKLDRIQSTLTLTVIAHILPPGASPILFDI